MTLDGKIALVTGGASGLGKEIARTLVQRGANVAINDINENELRQTAESIGATGYLCDVSKEEDVLDMYEKIRRDYGQIDILVANAGVGLSKRVVDSTCDDFDYLVGTNLKGIFLCVRESLRMMEGKGTIVTISSGMVRVPGYVDLGLYGLSKAGIENLTQCVAKEYPDLRAFTVLPGRMDTSLHQNMFPDYPMQRLMQPGTVAEKIVNLIERADIKSGMSFELYK